MKRIYLSMSLAAILAIGSTLALAGEQKFGRYPAGKPETQRNIGSAIKGMTLSKSELLKAGEALAPESVPESFPDQTVSPVNPEQAAAWLIPESAEKYRGTIFASTSSSGWGQIDIAKGTLTRSFTNRDLYNAGSYDPQGGAVRDGILYIPQYLQYSVRDTYMYWKRINIATGESLTPMVMPDMRYLIGAMCYDPTEDVFYGMNFSDESNVYANRIVRVDPNDNFNIEILATLSPDQGNNIVSMAYYAPENAVYGLREDGSLVQINKRSGLPTKIADLNLTDNTYGSLGFPLLLTAGGVQPFVYSPKDEAFLTIGSANGGSLTVLFAIDPSTGNMTPVSRLSDNVVYLTCTDYYAVNEAPADVEINSFDLKGAELSGSITFTAPRFLYSGIELNKEMNMTVTLDDEKIFTGKMQPGEKKIVNFSTTEGSHSIQIVPDLGEDLVGPPVIRRFYAGNDNPAAPTQFKLNGNTLTWAAPSAVGVHDGYVDTKALTYDVLFDGVVQNKTPLTETTFTFETPDELQRVNITVVAQANGKKSNPSAAISTVIGEALTLPQTFMPDQKEANLFIIADGNRDGNTFFFNKDNQTFETYREGGEIANEWLFLPAMIFPSTDDSYLISFDLSLIRTDPDVADYSAEDLTVCIGSAPNAASMTQTIYEIRNFQNLGENAEPLRQNLVFAVKEPGVYYLGLHNTADNGYGIQLSDFDVRVGGTSDAPAAVTDLAITPAERGGLSATVSFTAPTLNLIDKPLPAGKEISFEIYTSKYNTTVKGLPGAKVEAQIEAVQGYNDFYVLPKNDDGTGMLASKRSYIGLDKPTQALNLAGVASSDNLSMDLTWEMPTTGKNGGYVDPAEMTTKILQLAGVRWNLIASVPKGVHKYSFNPGFDTPASYTIGVAPSNEVGETTAGVSRVFEQLGAVYNMPLHERFSGTGRTYRGWHFNRVANTPSEFFYARSILDSSMEIFNIYGFPGFSNGGGNVVESMLGGAAEGIFCAPKTSSVGVDHPAVKFRYWNYASMPSMKLLARRYGDTEWKDISETIQYDPEAPDSFKEFQTNLDAEEWGQREWVEIGIYFDIKAGQYGFLDWFDFYDNVQYDTSLYALTGHDYTQIGETNEFTATVVNSGIEPRISGTVYMELLGDGKVLEKLSDDFRLRRVGDSNDLIFTFHATSELLSYEKVQIRASIECEDDEVTANNVRTIDWTIAKTDLPVITDLSGKWNDDHNAVTLNWSEPDLEYGATFDFENVPAWEITDKIGDWKNIDADGYAPFAIEPFAYDGSPWKNIGEKRAWQVVDAAELGTLVMQDSRVYPHSGKQYLCAMAGYDPESPDEAVKTADWLISPEIVGGTTLSYWVTTWEPNYREVCEIWVSKTDDQVSSFKTKVGNLSKSGSAGWEYASIRLPEDAKYVGIKYTGWNTMGYIIDDLRITPKNLNKWEIVKYAIFRHSGDWTDFAKVGETTTTSFTDPCGDNNGYYVVFPIVKTEVGERVAVRSNQVSMWSTGINAAEALSGVKAGKGEIVFSGFAGKSMRIYSTDGKTVAGTTLTADNVRFAVEAGIYVVSVDGKAMKVVVR